MYPKEKLEKDIKYQYFTLTEGGWIDREYQPLSIAADHFDPKLLKLLFLTDGPLKGRYILNGFIYNNIYGPSNGHGQDEIDLEPNDDYCDIDCNLFTPNELVNQAKLYDAE